MSIENLRKRIPVCEHGTPNNLSLDLLNSIARLERLVESTLEFTSGYRCMECNVKAGGVKNSAHTRGMAVDIHCTNSQERFQILQVALAIGFSRTGIGRSFIHLDVDTSLPQDVIWTYE